MSSNKMQSKEAGYISFTQDDWQQAKQNNPQNSQAYDLLCGALSTPSEISDAEDIYPCSREECKKMDSLLDEAAQNVNDPNDVWFQQAHAEVKDIVNWSLKKHWTFKWGLILGCILALFALKFMSGCALKDTEEAKERIKTVEAWQEQKPYTLAFEKCQGQIEYGAYYKNLNDPKMCKQWELNHNKSWYNDYIKKEKEERKKADTATTRKEEYLTRAENHKQQAEWYKQYYDSINAMSFAEFKQHTINGLNDRLSDKEGIQKFWIGFLIFCLILIPFYIWSSKQYGFVISRHRVESSILDGLQKAGFTIASIFLGSGLAMQLLPDNIEIWKYMNGRTETHRSVNGLNVGVMMMKLGMMAVGLIIFMFVSIFIMTFSTITGIIRKFKYK